MKIYLVLLCVLFFVTALPAKGIRLPGSNIDPNQEIDVRSQGVSVGCVGDASAWDAGWGTCDTYDASHDSENHKYCEEDNVDGQYAYQVCQECGACKALGCVGDASAWDAGWGICATYETSHKSENHKYCEEDNVDGQYASQVCQECGACIDLGCTVTECSHGKICLPDGACALPIMCSPRILENEGPLLKVKMDLPQYAVAAELENPLVNGTILWFSCRRRAKLRGPLKSKCTSDGSWKPPVIPDCNTSSSPVVAIIRGVQTMSVSETLTLSGSKSHDPDGNIFNKPVTYKWEIFNMDSSDVISNGTKIELPSTSEISLVGRGNLEAGSSYKFVLTYRVGSRVSTAVHIVEVITCADCIPPSIVFTTTDTVFDPSKNVLISAHLKSTVSASYEWSIDNAVDEVTDLGETLGDIEGGLTTDNCLTAIRGAFIGEIDIALKLKENVLTVLGHGTYYTFRLTVTDIAGVDASAVFTLKTTDDPIYGVLPQACDPNPCNIGSDCSDENGDGTAECTCIGDACETTEDCQTTDDCDDGLSCFQGACLGLEGGPDIAPQDIYNNQIYLQMRSYKRTPLRRRRG